MDEFLKFHKSNKNRLKYSSNSSVLENFVVRSFTVKNENYRFIPHASPENSCISPLKSFLPGLTFDIISSARTRYPNVKIDISEVKDIVIPFSIKPDSLVNCENSEKYTYFDYQSESIYLGLKYGRGIFNLATGAGKSLLIYGLILNIWKYVNPNYKVLILVPNIQLVSQMYKDICEYGCSVDKISMYSSFSSDFKDSLITVSNRQWLENHGDYFINNTNILMVDEVHGLCKGNNVAKYVTKFITPIRYGLTGTLPSDKENLWNIIGICGKVLKVKTPYELQKEDRISKAKIVVIRFNHNKMPPLPPETVSENGVIRELDKLERAKMKFPIEMNFIEKNEYSNSQICKLVYGLTNNSIVLYDHIMHGNHLLELMNVLNKDNQNKKQVFLIDGETEIEYRENVRSLMEKDSNCILLANTKCFSIGINIKNIYNIAFAFSSGKAAAKIIQSIGRGLRKKENKNYLLLIDFYHNFSYSIKHFTERKRLYEENYDAAQIIYKNISI